MGKSEKEEKKKKKQKYKLKNKRLPRMVVTKIEHLWDQPVREGGRPPDESMEENYAEKNTFSRRCKPLKLRRKPKASFGERESKNNGFIIR